MLAVYRLEATDAHHRYGSNLHPYHQHWHSSSTLQPFFYWLDFGDGKQVNAVGQVLGCICGLPGNDA